MRIDRRGGGPNDRPGDSRIDGTSDQTISRWARLGAIGVLGVAAIGLVDTFGAPTGAQSADVVAELVSVDAEGAALGGSNTRPSVSDDGNTIVFTNFSPAGVVEPGVFDLVVRRRSVDVGVARSLLIAVGSKAPLAAAVSGDGCVVAYSAVVPRPAEEKADAAADADADAVEVADAVQVADEAIELRTLNLCGAPGIEPATVVLDRIDASSPGPVVPLPAPALASNGSIVAFATSSSIAMYEAASTPDTPLVATMAAPDGLRIGDRLDLTADGRTVVFEAGPPTDASPDDASPDDAAPDDAAPDEGAPDDGAPDGIDPSVYLATVEPGVLEADLPVIGVELFAPSDAGSSWPSISATGDLVVYQSSQQLPIVGVPAAGSYVVLAERSETGTTHRVLTDTAVRPDLAADGAAIAYDLLGSVQIRRSNSAEPFEDFTERIVNPKVGVEFVEGAGASVSGVALSGDGKSVVFDQPAGVALSDPQLPGEHVWVQAIDPLFAPPPTPPTIDTTTTSTIAITQPTVTRNTTRNTTRTTSRDSVATTATPVVLPVAFLPAAFEFAPTIINAGRRTAAVDLSNPTATDVTVTSIVVEAAGAADFTVDSTACPTIAAGATCAVSVVFAPSTVGERTTTVIATLSDGSTAAIALRGIGAPEPILAVLPGVASNGQVVAVVGSGFPAGATVEFRWNGAVITTAILIDDQGGFTETRVVLPNSMSGPTKLVVEAQVDLFGEVSTTLLVSDSSSRGNTAVVGGGVTGASLGR